MPYFIPVLLMYITFIIGIILFICFRSNNISLYNKIRYLYIIMFFITLITYLIWGIMRNFT